jgi:lysophospholipase L1-like esterase
VRSFRPPGAAPLPVSVAALLVCVAVALGATSVASPLSSERPPVALIGDSITWGASDTFQRVLGDRWRLMVDGRIGYRIAQQLPAAERAGRLPNRQVVINLGTNDVTNTDAPITSLIEDLRELIDRVRDAECIHLVTVNERIAGRGPAVQDRAAALNAAMRELAAGDPRIDVIDWSGALAAWEAEHPGRTLTSDTIHPNAEGNTLLAGLYRDALERCGSRAAARP